MGQQRILAVHTSSVESEPGNLLGGFEVPASNRNGRANCRDDAKKVFRPVHPPTLL
jgi:hypothetical protein